MGPPEHSDGGAEKAGNTSPTAAQLEADAPCRTPRGNELFLPGWGHRRLRSPGTEKARFTSSTSGIGKDQTIQADGSPEPCQGRRYVGGAERARYLGSSISMFE